MRDTINTIAQNAQAICDGSLDGADIAEIVDMGATLKKAIDALGKLDKSIKKRILSEATDGVAHGTTFTAKITEQVRWTLNAPAIKEEMGEEWVTAHSKPAHVRSVRYGV